MLVDMRVTQLLSSRLCHDLIGPVSAVQNGTELIDEMGSDAEGDALRLISMSADQLSARLAFFRVAFGMGGLSGVKPMVVEVREIAFAYFNGGRVALDWKKEKDTSFDLNTPLSILKLLMNLLLVGIDALPRGGVLFVSSEGTSIDHGESEISIVVRAVGVGAHLKDDVFYAISSKKEENADHKLNAHNVHGFFCQRLAASLSSTIEIASNKDEVSFVANVKQPKI